MIFCCYIDETGMDGPRVMLAGYVAPLHKWHGFRRKWNELLRDEGIYYSHIMEMRSGKSPFEGWDTNRISSFVKKSSNIVKKYCDLGLTAAVNKDNRKKYALNMPQKTSPDSAYGMCARQFFEQIPLLIQKYVGVKSCRVNFIFEHHRQHFGDAERIFDQIKRTDPRYANWLGSIKSAECENFAGLQAADILAYSARRYEPKAEFIPVPSGIGSRVLKRIGVDECPIFRIDIDEDAIPLYHDAASEIRRRLLKQKRLLTKD